MRSVLTACAECQLLFIQVLKQGCPRIYCDECKPIVEIVKINKRGETYRRKRKNERS